jgi:hypothetical protein
MKEGAQVKMDKGDRQSGLTLEGAQPIGEFSPIRIFWMMSKRLDISDRYVRKQLSYRADCFCCVSRYLVDRIMTVKLFFIDVAVN